MKGHKGKAEKLREENDAYVERYVKNMIAMSRKTTVVFGGGKFMVEMPDMRYVDGMGFEWNEKK